MIILRRTVQAVLHFRLFGQQLVDFLLVGRHVLLRRLQLRFELLQLVAIDRAAGLLELRLGDLHLELLETPLRVFPVPVVVVPDHPDDRQEQEQAGRRKDDVEEVDVVRVPDTLLFSHIQILKKYSPIETMYFRLNSHRASILMGSAIIIRNRNAPT